MVQVRSLRNRLALLVVLMMFSQGLSSAAEAEQPGPVPNALACESVTLLTPTNRNGSVSCPINFSWTSSSDADGYQLVVRDSGNKIVVNTTTTAKSLSTLLAPGTYQWLVIAKGSRCVDAPSEAFEFRVVACCPSTGPEPVSPADRASVEGPVKFTWTSVFNTPLYEIRVFDKNTEAIVLREESTTNSYLDSANKLGIGAFFWQVIAFPEDCDPITSDSSSFEVVDPCPDAAPTPVSPRELDEKTSPITFAWTSVEGATYVFRIFDENGDLFAEKEVDGQTITGSLDPGSYSWSIEAQAEGCDSLPSDKVSFKVVDPCPSVAPELINPIEITVESPVEFFWSGVDGASAYRVTVFLGNSQVGQKTVAGTSVTIELPAGVYSWSVEALAVDCEPVSSRAAEFKVIETVICPNDAPKLLSPANGAEEGTSVRLAWSAVDNATQYRVIVTKDGVAFLSQLIAGNLLNLNLSPATYQWQVIALADECESLSSAVWAFKVLAEDPVCPTAGSSLGAPANGAELNSTTVNFSWSAVPGATKYLLRLFSASSLAAEKGVAGTSLSISLGPGIYAWNVVSAVPGCDSVTSATRKFSVVQGSCPSFGPALISPLSGAKQRSPVTFSWSKVTGAETYRFVLATGNKIVTDQKVAGTSLVRSVDPGEYTWWVEAQAENCDAKSSEKRFVVVTATSTICPKDRPLLLRPAPGDEVGSPTILSWSQVPGASRYRVTILEEGVRVFEGETTATTMTRDLPTGDYDWYLQAVGDGCVPVPSEKSYFRVVCSRGAPVLSAPVGGVEVSSPVTFSWSPVGGAEGYLIQVFLGRDLLIEKKLEGTLITLELRPGEYRWLVAALFAECPPEASEAAKFVVPEKNPCPETGASLISPPDDSELTSSMVHFQWTPVEGAIGYWLALAKGGRFDVVKKTEATAVDLDLDPGEYRWRVVSLFERCEFLESEISSFVIPEDSSCDNVAVSLISPEQGANVAPPVTFVWNGAEGAFGYVLMLVPASGSPTPIAKTTQTMYTAEDLRPGEYEWFVVALFDRCRPTESAHRRFAIPYDRECNQRGPLLLQPRNLERILSSPVSFRWTAVANATGYQVWIIPSPDEAPVPITEVISETEAEVDLESGTYRWFVRVILDNCPIIRSAIFEFHVGDLETADPCPLTERPEIQAIGSVSSGETYTVFWSRVPNASAYEIQEAENLDFRNSTQTAVTGNRARFRHEALRETAYFYRVRGLDRCTEAGGPFSTVIRVVVVPELDPRSSRFGLITELGEDDPIIQEIQNLGGTGDSSVRDATASQDPAVEQGRQRPIRRPVVIEPDLEFTAESDVPWLSLFPSSGQVPGEGLVVTATADPANLPPGTSTATVTVTTTPGSQTSASQTEVLLLPVSVSLTTPLAPTSSGVPDSNSKIVPVVSHSTTSGTSTNISNVAVANLSADIRSYELIFRPADEEIKWRTAQLQLGPGQTTALDDVVATWFGAEEGQTTTGTLEIRSLDTPSTSQGDDSTVASGLNFFSAIEGSVGGLIPAIPFSEFVDKKSTQISSMIIPNVNQNSTMTSSLGLVEGLGQPATVNVSVYSSSNQLVAQQSVTLAPGGLADLSSMLEGQSVTGGRAEITVSSDTGQVMAFNQLASAVGGDTQFVAASSLTASSEKRVIPGAAAGESELGSRQTDVYLYNSGVENQVVTMTFYPESDPDSGVTRQVLLQPGEGTVLEDVVASTFNQSNKRGAIHLDADSPELIVTSAASYLDGSQGRVGSLLPAISTSQAVGTGDRPLQMLQLQESSSYSSDIGIAEVSGADATLEISAVAPGALSSPAIQMQLRANEFRQVSSVLNQMGLGTTYNVRLTVRVVDGSGRIASYACLVDKASNDETVLPGQ